jgi:hypothetical protein
LPMVTRVDAPRFVILSDRKMPVAFEVMGTASVSKGSHRVTATLYNGDPQNRTEVVQDLAAGRQLVFDLSGFTPGKYFLKVEIIDAIGESCSQKATVVECLAGLRAHSA